MGESRSKRDFGANLQANKHTHPKSLPEFTSDEVDRFPLHVNLIAARSLEERFTRYRWYCQVFCVKFFSANL